MIVCQQELGPRRSEITYDRQKNFDNERCHDPHINSNQINVRKVSWIRKTGDFIPDAPRADGWCSDADNEIDFRFPVAGAPSRGGGIEQCSIPQPRDEMHTVHWHKRCYECCRYSCCRAMRCHSGTQIHWREWQRTIDVLLDGCCHWFSLVVWEGRKPVARSYLGCVANCITNLTHIWKH